MNSHPRAPQGRVVASLVVVLLSAALGASGAALHPWGGGQASARAVGPVRVRALDDAEIYSRLEPSVVDVTSSLRYDGETAAGTGIVIDARAGLVLTNNHVIRGATAVTARLTSTGRTYPARIVGTDAGADIAVLQLQGATGLTAAPLGDSGAVTVGTPVLALGNRAGRNEAPATARGVVNGLNQTIRAADGISGFTETLHGMLQTSTRIEPGDSGGPLGGPAGTVIGMDTAAGTGTAPTGYAIPIGAAMALERQITAGRHAPGITLGTGGFLGVEVTSAASPGPRPQTVQARALHASGGAPSSRISCLGADEVDWGRFRAAMARLRREVKASLGDGVRCDTGAAAAGIAPGDVITAVAGQPVASAGALAEVLGTCRPGAVVPVTWITVAGVRRSSQVRLDTAPAA